MSNETKKEEVEKEVKQDIDKIDNSNATPEQKADHTATMLDILQKILMIVTPKEATVSPEPIPSEPAKDEDKGGDWE